MRLTKFVPISHTLTALSDMLTGVRDDPAHPEQEFLDWWRTTETQYRNPHDGRSTLLHAAALPTDEVRSLLHQVPDTPAGHIWSTVVADALERTETDGYRPYDEIVVGGPRADRAARELTALIEQIRETSPLLEPVADELDYTQDTHEQTLRLGEIPAMRARIDPTRGVALDGNTEPEDTKDHRPVTRWAPWEHIDLLAPGTNARILAVLADLDADLPPLATTPDPRHGN